MSGEDGEGGMWHLLGRCQGLRAFLLFLRRLGVVLWAPALAQSMLGPCSVGGVCEGIPQTRGSFSLLGVRGTGEGPRPALLLPASLWPRHLQAPQDPRRHGGVGTASPSTAAVSRELAVGYRMTVFIGLPT